MRYMMVLTCLLAVVVSSFSQVALAEEKETSYYLIGNSLTWDTVPSLLDGDVQWHVDCGKSLPFMYANPQKPCVSSSSLWPTALKNKKYDIISVQPFYGSTLAEDVKVISKWIEMQPDAVFVIHTGWANQAKRAAEYADNDTSGKLVHSPAYFDALIAALQKKYPDRTFRSTHAIDLLAKIAADVKAGVAPITAVSDLHRDVIHMKLDTGRYLMHNAMRHALGQKPSVKGFEKIDPKMKEYLDSVLATLK